MCQWNIEQRPTVLFSQGFLCLYHQAARHNTTRYETYLQRIIAVWVCHQCCVESDCRHGARNNVHTVVSPVQSAHMVGCQRPTETVTRNVRLVVLVHGLILEVLDMADNVVQRHGPLGCLLMNVACMTRQHHHQQQCHKRKPKNNRTSKTKNKRIRRVCSCSGLVDWRWKCQPQTAK